MRFEFIYKKNLPKLAWGAIVSKELIKLYHGSNVEIGENYFVEGAWNDNYEKKNFDSATFFLGSGGKILDTDVIFSTSSHTLERLHGVKKDKCYYISNSLAFVLEIAQISLNINYLNYEEDFNSIKNGYKDYVNRIPSSEGYQIELYYYTNILIDQYFNISTYPKIEEEAFKDFDDYILRITNAVEQIKINAQSSERKQTYGLISTISNGYDAATCAAIARTSGCEQVVSFDRPKKYLEDCGENIGEILGYKKIIKKDANEYLSNQTKVETEYLSSGELGSGIVFSAFDQEFRNNIVFYGFRGDSIWERSGQSPNSNMCFIGDIVSITSLYESRLRVGYILFPLPLFAATRWPSINRISNSEEMREWTLFNNYDRPIPRRILETYVRGGG